MWAVDCLADPCNPSVPRSLDTHTHTHTFSGTRNDLKNSLGEGWNGSSEASESSSQPLLRGPFANLRVLALVGVTYSDLALLGVQRSGGETLALCQLERFVTGRGSAIEYGFACSCAEAPKQAARYGFDAYHLTLREQRRSCAFQLLQCECRDPREAPDKSGSEVGFYFGPR